MSLYLFLTIQSDGAQHLAGVACWCHLLVSLLLVGRLAEMLGGWAPLCTLVLGSHSPRISPCGLGSKVAGSRSSQECKAVVARPSYDLTAELPSITSTALC